MSSSGLTGDLGLCTQRDVRCSEDSRGGAEPDKECLWAEHVARARAGGIGDVEKDRTP